MPNVPDKLLLCRRRYSNYYRLIYYAIEVGPNNKPDVLSLQYVTGTCFRKIFSVKSKDVVHECETEFGVFPVSDEFSSPAFPVPRFQHPRRRY